MKLAAAVVLLFALGLTDVECAHDDIEVSPDTVEFAMIEGKHSTVGPRVEIVTATKLDKGHFHHASAKSNVDWIDAELFPLDDKTQELTISINEKANELEIGTHEGKTGIFIGKKVATAVTVTLIVEKNHPIHIVYGTRPSGCMLGTGSTIVSVWLVAILLLFWVAYRISRS